jgi:hypothetical protein
MVGMAKVTFFCAALAAKEALAMRIAMPAETSILVARGGAGSVIDVSFQ